MEEKGDQRSEFLRYGALIALALNENMFIYSPGMIDVSVRLQLFPSYESSEFNFAIFRVLPASMFNVQNDVLRRVKDVELAQDDAIGVLDESLEGEMKTNIQIYTNLKGKPVKFGATIQLQHVSSHRFLTVKGQENADYEKDSLKVTLEDYSSAHTHYTVEHAFNYQKEGDEHVRLNDRVLLQLFVRELNKAVYIHSIGGGEKESPFSRLRTLSIPRRLSRLRDSVTVEVNASPESMTPWTIREFSPYIEEDTLNLKFGEYVWIKLSEQNAVLSVSQDEAASRPHSLLFQSELHDTNGLWKVENEEITKGGLVPIGRHIRFRHISTGLFLSAGYQRKSVSNVEELTSMIAENVRGRESQELLLVPTPEAGTLWDLEMISSRHKLKNAKKDEFYRVKHHLSSLYIGPVDKEGVSAKVPGLISTATEETVVKIVRCEDSTVWETQFLLNSLPILKNYPRFIDSQNRVTEQAEFVARNREFKKEIALVRKCLKELDSFCKNKLQGMISLNKSFATIDPVRQKILREQYFIDALVELLKCTFTGVYDLAKTRKMKKEAEEEPGGKPGVSLLSVEFTVAEHLQRVKHETLRSQLRELLDTVEDAYDLVMTVCQGNPENQLYTFRFCEVFIRHAAYLDKSISCLISIIQNNEELLMKVASPSGSKGTSRKESVINKFLFLLRKHSVERNPRLLYFLRSVCKMNNEGISLNQEKIGEALFGNSETYDKVVITTITARNQRTLNVMLRPDDGIGQVEVELDSCFEDGLLVRFQHELTYFSELLNLFADITASRNHICREAVQKWFPISTLQHNMWNEEISPEFRAGFSRLITTLYLDSYPREERKIPELCRILQKGDELEPIDSKTFVRTHRISDEGQKEEITGEQLGKDFVVPIGPDTEVIHRLKQDLLEFLAGQLLQDVNDPQNPKANFDSMTYELVTIAWKMVKFDLFGAACSYFNEGYCVLSPKSSLFKYADMDLARLLEILSKILLSEDSHQVRAAVTNLKSGRKAGWKRKRQTNSILDDVTNKPSALADPIMRYSVNIRNFVDSVLSQVDTIVDFNSFEVRTKMELCQIFNYALDCRVNFLVTNVVAWFVDSVQETVPKDEAIKLFPPIIQVKILNSPPGEFIAHFEPEIKDLDEITDSRGALMLMFLKAFLTITHYDLQAEFLRLLLRSFNQRTEMVTHLDNLHILSDEGDIQMFQWAKDQLVNLRHCVEQTEVWVKYWTNPSKDNNLEKVHEVISLLEQYEIALFQDSRIQNNRPAGPGKKVVKWERQRMMYHLNIHSLIVTMMKDGMHTLAEMIEAHSRPGMQEAINIITRVFTKAHSLLTNFVKENPRNQKALAIHLPTFAYYLKINVGQEQLLSALYMDNYDLCVAVKEDLLLEFAHMIVSHGRQPRFLLLFNSIQICHGKPIAENQRKVLNILLNSQHKTHFLYLKPDKLDEFLFEKQAPHLGASIYYEDHPVWYHIALLKVFTMCCYGDKGVYLNEAKCQKAVSLNMVVALLERLEDEKSPLYKYVKAIHLPIMEFFYHIFLNTERITEEVVSHAGLLAYLRSQEDKVATMESIPPRSVKFFEWLLRLVGMHAQTFQKTCRKTESAMVEHEDFTVLKSFAKTVNDNFRKFESVEFAEEAREDILNFCKTFEIMGESLRFKSNVPPQPLEATAVMAAKRRWNLLTAELIYNAEMKEMLFMEKQQLIELLIGSQHATAELSRERVLQTLVTFLQHARSQKVEVGTTLQVIEIFQTLLAPRGKIEADSEKLGKLQTEMNGYGLVKVCLVLMSEPQLSSRIFRSLIRLCIYLLWGGNIKIQTEFYNYFKNVQASEHFFERVECFIGKETRVITSGAIPSTAKLTCYEEPPEYMKYIMRLLQLLCENHNQDLQNYLRLQFNSRVSHNMITLTVVLLSALMKKMHFRKFHLISQCFDTLTEAIQGPCAENQIAIIDSQFLDTAVNLLSYSEQSNRLERYPSLKSDEAAALPFDEEVLMEDDQRSYLHGWMIAHLKHKCMITLHSLLEGRSDTYVITHMIRKLHLELLRSNLLSFYENYQKRYRPGYYNEDLFGHDADNDDYDFERTDNPQDIDPQYFEVLIECPFLVYHLIKKFRDLDNPENTEFFQEELPDSMIEGSASTLFGLKIFGDIGKMSLALFQKGVGAVKTLTKFTGEQNQEELEEELQKRRREMVYSFFEMFTGHVEVVFREDIFKVYFALPYFYLGFTPEAKQRFDLQVDRSSSKAKLNYLQLNMPDMIRVMEHEDRLRRFFSKHVMLSALASRPDFWEELAFLMSLCINFAILFSFSIYGTDRIDEYSLFYKASDESKSGLDMQGTIWFFRVCGCIHCVSAGVIVSFFIMKEWPILASRGWRSVPALGEGLHSRCMRSVHMLRRLSAVCFYLFTSFQVIFYLLFIIFSILGQVVNPLFFAFHMLDVSKRYPVLKAIIKSITTPRKTLILSFIFVLMIIYMFSIAGYAFLGDDYHNNGLSLWLTFITSFDRTWKNTGGVGAYLGSQTPGEVDIFRLIYDNLFNIAVMIIWLNIVSTVIMDTFTTLRERNDQDVEDRENKCFICSEHRDIIERLTNHEFRRHICYEHNVWNYVFFLAYIVKKEETEYTGIESYVRECYDHTDINWFPQYQALSFKDQETDVKKKVVENLREVEDTMETLERDIREARRKMGSTQDDKNRESSSESYSSEEESEDSSSISRSVSRSRTSG